MALDFKPIVLDAAAGDSSGMLVLRQHALLAVVARLGDLHGELAGHWYVEAVFYPGMAAPRDPFPTTEAVEAWLEAHIV